MPHFAWPPCPNPYRGENGEPFDEHALRFWKKANELRRAEERLEAETKAKIKKILEDSEEQLREIIRESDALYAVEFERLAPETDQTGREPGEPRPSAGL